jgi:uncharacterized membrane protein (Fun14 family)
MNKPVVGLLLGGALGVFDGLTALFSAPELKPAIAGIVAGSVVKGLVAGLIIGFVSRKVNNLAIGVLAGLAVGALCALPFATAPDPTSGKVYFWEILIPGSIVGVIVGYATQRYGARASASPARA